MSFLPAMPPITTCRDIIKPPISSVSRIPGWESFGIVLLEAMSTGKPIVASAIDGFTSVLTDGVEGIAVPPRDVEKLAEAILKLIRDEQLRQQMGTRGKPKAQQYDWSLLAKRVLDFYTETLKRIRPSGVSHGSVNPQDWCDSLKSTEPCQNWKKPVEPWRTLSRRRWPDSWLGPRLHRTP